MPLDCINKIVICSIKTKIVPLGPTIMPKQYICTFDVLPQLDSIQAVATLGEGQSTMQINLPNITQLVVATKLLNKKERLNCHHRKHSYKSWKLEQQRGL